MIKILNGFRGRLGAKNKIENFYDIMAESKNVLPLKNSMSNLIEMFEPLLNL
jgi:hypothetical protein